MSILKEFKQFAMKGNAVELAVAFIMGGAFGKIVSSLVADVIMPPLGIVAGGVNFSHLKIVLKKGVSQQMEQGKMVQDAVAEVSLNYGVFLQNVLDFLIIAFAMFLTVKAINTVKARIAAEEEEAKSTDPSEEVKLLTEIRDSLKGRDS
ncbi:MAG: large-conductance mechanosensitive channel protein MscL [Bacteroidia bacterium]|jgi:large conductance mechanosensitive channel